MRLSNFRYTLPKTKIADHPAEPRDSCKMMVLNRRKKDIEHKVFEDIASYFKKGDLLILNNSRVFPAKIFGQKEKTDAKIEVFLLRVLNREAGLWDVLVDPARKVRVGNKIYFDEDVVAEVVDNTTSRGRTIRFLNPEIDVFSLVDRIGNVPLPPYFTRKSKDSDKENYQTVYANQTGSVVAPMAGLHFTMPLLQKIQKIGVKVLPITLHPSLSTFNAIEVEDVSKHKMDSEYFNIPYQTAMEINETKMKKTGRVIAVGTTTCRVLEANATVDGKIKFGQGWTDKFIYPPYQFKVTDALVTNFQQPETTLLMVVSAFAEHRLLMDAYKVALKSDYKFLAYGDAMFIH
ncbi:MAG: tRNA preQ1(34) S-adenosylmethionine ribosyltransferase-isomerase QueA [Pelodictyon luteolum]|uniref:S-adenosylmethionine:tRNA ribosyltransferase-isomerase n=1 Tax=Pelodictyon luteolum TaxID=1100 RepID=A0A165LQD6_PELLU|nr:tRNA preQ1(34) S-adenosylmethionine ribosyltransferase-isomerase QueA [Pelodictyon luteolum]KZK74301.1 MAG: tRNA preQ1(34) S-adenosylmethionine ribosyltransferase-isomerase QueA [Pelodictyon luteolum]